MCSSDLLSGTLTRVLSVAPADAGGPFVLRNLVVLSLGPQALRIAILLAQLAVVALIGWATLGVRRSEGAAPVGPQRSRLGEFGLVLCGMVLLVPAVFCADHLLRCGRRDGKVLGLLIAAALLGLGSVKGLLGKDAGNFVLGLGAVTWSTVAMLLATVCALRGSVRRSSDSL